MVVAERYTSRADERPSRDTANNACERQPNWQKEGSAVTIDYCRGFHFIIYKNNGRLFRVLEPAWLRPLPIILDVLWPRAASAQPAMISPTKDSRAGNHREITVDASSANGRLRSLQGVNGAPAAGMHKPENFKFGGWNMPEKVDVATGYRLARIDLVRTHDAYGPGDIDSRFESAEAPGGGLISARRDAFVIFPNPDANPDDPHSYNFEPTDQLVGSIVKAGAQVMFRVGRSEGADPDPPRNFERTRRSSATWYCTTTPAGPRDFTTTCATGKSGTSRISASCSGPIPANTTLRCTPSWRAR